MQKRKVKNNNMRPVEAVPWVILGVLIILYFLMYVYIYARTTNSVVEKVDIRKGELNIKTTSAVVERKDIGEGELNIKTTSTVVEKEDIGEGELNIKTTSTVVERRKKKVFGVRKRKQKRPFYSYYDKDEEMNHIVENILRGAIQSPFYSSYDKYDNYNWFRNMISTGELGN